MKIAAKETVFIGKIAGLIAAVLLAASLPGLAQHGAAGHLGGHVGGGHPSTRPAGRIATPLNPNFAPIRGVPGLGFDYQHLVAVGGAARNRNGVPHRAGRSFITPIFGLGVPYYYAFDSGYPYDSGASTEQASAAPLVPAIPDQGEAAYTEAEVPTPSVAPQLLAPQVPPPELGQLIMVRHDGQVVMAVAFTTSGGQLTYITQNGLRRSFPVAELDADATRQMNSVNGTSIALPD